MTIFLSHEINQYYKRNHIINKTSENLFYTQKKGSVKFTKANRLKNFWLK